ncbi:MAG TPA: hypothetical protein VN238_01810 [Solirubrobacteraceae bacterium]|nr:hypothetical protein [Solirubrobacteraceae bacterium]
MSELTVEEFRTAVEEPFAVEAADGPVPGDPRLVLSEARGLGRAFGDREAYVLTFQGPAAPYLPQGTYRLVHDRLGPQEIFIVPVAQSDAGYEYEANFT